ncbi:MAG: flagellar filament outer layer protein FlaA [Leptospiraceae bacterium]|nr:flagellar filament outer layer protein FlaA [Leptospiraceae bacterium]MDW8307067.1 flagellar filament outer layer protein FlaA [Leptospiraceae bacterium]
MGYVKNVALNFFLFSIPALLFGQAELKLKAQYEKEIAKGIYSEITIEDFSYMPFQDEDILKREGIKGHLSLSELYPAPFYRAGRYLKLEIESVGSDALQISFRPPREIRKYVRAFFLWVHGTNLPGDLLLVLEDTRGSLHNLSFGKLNFRGWRKLKAEVSASVVQEDLTPGEPLAVRIVQLIYRPGPPHRVKKNQVFFIDHLTAQVREKYLLP